LLHKFEFWSAVKVDSDARGEIEDSFVAGTSWKSYLKLYSAGENYSVSVKERYECLLSITFSTLQLDSGFSRSSCLT
jgi:hypothetical protein